jgi:hypothetical protein
MKKVLIIIIVVIILAAVGVASYYFIQNKGNKDTKTTQSVSTGEKLSIPQKILENKFGWLGGGPDDTGEGIIAHNGLWVRPHPGAFVWDMMQKSKDFPIDFTFADQEINNYQKNNIGILATIWPFADWDQKNLANAVDCKVSDKDEFLQNNDKKGRGSYLPYYRCNPSNWVAYQTFVKAIVERYNGDGVNDMPGLIIPIKYWEVMNEPDLQLCFYRQGPTEYAKLLTETSKAIRTADPEAKILIAGPAGADERALSFFQEVFKNAEARNAFDIGNIHCITNDQNTHDFNVAPYKKMLADAGVAPKPIWVTEADAMYSTTGEENYQSTKVSTTNAISAGADRIFYTGDEFDNSNYYPSEVKFRELIENFTK